MKRTHSESGIQLIVKLSILHKLDNNNNPSVLIIINYNN